MFIYRLYNKADYDVIHTVMSFFININVDHLIKIMDLLNYPKVNHCKVILLMLHSNNSTGTMWHYMTSLTIQ